MKTEFKMTEEELDKMKSISQSDIPVMKFGSYWSGLDKQERANVFWIELSEKYKFVWNSAGPSEKGIMYFMAEKLN